jgi:hypothetical protein
LFIPIKRKGFARKKWELKKKVIFAEIKEILLKENVKKSRIKEIYLHKKEI